MNNKFSSDSKLIEFFDKAKIAKRIALTELENLFERYDENSNNNPIEHIKSRIKSYDSIEAKLLNKNYEVNVSNIREHIHDVVGIRIVCSFLSDVEEIVDIIKKSDIFIIREENDYIKNPKDSGYISYHMNVLVEIRDNEFIEAEIQIRTVAMDFWASLDHKLRYKTNTNIPDDIMNEVYSCSRIISDLDLKMEKLRKKII